MRCIIELAIFSALCLQMGVSLRCYSCYSTANFSHCNQNFERVICPPWLDVCAKSHVISQRWGKEYHAYEHGCFANDFCNTKACKYIGRHYNAQACNITCCDVELCNSGASGSESKKLIAVSLAFSLLGMASSLGSSLALVKFPQLL